MKKFILILLILLTLNLQAEEHSRKSEVVFYELIDMKKTNKYGDKIYNQDISIASWVRTYKFWSRFNNPEDLYYDDYVKTRGTIQILLKGSNLCSLRNTKGCGSQSALIIDDYMVSDNMSIMVTDDDNLDGIHPIKVQRSDYSQSENIDDSFRKLLNVNSQFTYLDSFDYQDRKDYIHNNMVGLDSPIEVKTGQPFTYLKYDYATPDEVTEKCSFFRFEVNSFFCRSSAGMFIDAWVPLLHFDESYKIEPKPDIIVDTEYSILALQGEKLKETNVINRYDNHGGILKEVFRPMISMFGMMRDWMFGTRDEEVKGTSLVQVDYDFSDKPLVYSFFTTSDKRTINGKIETKITGVHSVYGAKTTMCKVQYKTKFFFFPIKKNYTFIKGTEAPTDRLYITKDAYDILEPEQRGKSFKMFKGNIYYAKMNTDDWLDYCMANNQKDGDKGFFGYSMERIARNNIYALSPITYMMSFGRSFFDLFRDEYTVKEIEQEVKRGLILDLELMPNSIPNSELYTTYHLVVDKLISIR